LRNKRTAGSQYGQNEQKQGCFSKKIHNIKALLNFRRPLHAVNQRLFYYKTHALPKSPTHSLKFKKSTHVAISVQAAIRNNR
jgi:hypothetical protein